MYNFNADEIFEMACQIEKNGYNFYLSAAESVDDEEGKLLLTELADMEKQHQSTFEQLRAQLNKDEKERTTFDPDNLMYKYCASMADMHVFNDANITDGNLRSILKRALRAEKDTIAFFVGMKYLIPENLGRNQIDNIIKEEISHINLLTKKLQEI
ncbi:ferritin family protein [Bacteroidota bacterium]